MKYLNIFLLLVMVMALTISLSAASIDQEEAYYDDDEAKAKSFDASLPHGEKTVSLRGTSRFLAQRSGVTMTCNKYPRMCRAKGSPGPDCCNKKCVNVLTDRINCGKCGKKCKYYETCCKGKCVNPLSDKKNCGGCNNKCKKGSACVYGMCNYA